MSAPSYLVRAAAEHPDPETPIFRALLAEHAEEEALAPPDFEIPDSTEVES